MKNQILNCLVVVMFFTLSAINGIAQKSKTDNSPLREKSTGIPKSINNKTGELPEGVTNEWLNSIRDENGKKITGNDPETDAFQTRSFTGFNAGDQYGVKVSSAGDVNGDGFDDIIVGAPYCDVSGAGTDAGRAYIYYGGLNVSTIPNVILSGNEAYDYFGISVSAAGDVNGDGYSDVIVGEQGYNNLTGRALIFFGGAPMNSAQDVVMTGENALDFFGNSVSSAGDVNGDGYSDVIIGADNYSNGKGRAYICLGGQYMDNIPDVVMTGQTNGDQFGVSVSAGDINNDGFSDVLVGANFFNNNKGRAYLYYGGSIMNNAVDIIFNGLVDNDNFGCSSAFVGDVNGDSFIDLAIGASGHNNGSGIVYLYYGGPNMDNLNDLILVGEASSSFFGNSVSTAGDINGDGFADVLVGDPYNGNGKSFVYYGGTSMDEILDLSFSGESVNSFFGNSVAFAGDVNGDGFSDILIGANGFNNYSGKAYLYMEGMNGTLFPQLTLNGLATNNQFGISIASAGDMNGDGYSDVIVGAYYNSTGFGKAYLFFGGTNMDNIADVTFTGDVGTTNFGCSVSAAGDVNGDGFSDIIIGANAYLTNTGRAYIYYGSFGVDNVVDVVLTGGAVNNYFGTSVSTVGDFNGDGYSDVVVGAYGAAQNAGRTYIYFGGSPMNNGIDVINAGLSPEQFGYSVASAGDVNGDGYSDMIVGANRYNNYTGRAYIFYGGPNNLGNSAGVVMTGEGINNYFGNSVSSAGDVNGDGYSDVIVGAYGANKSYIFYGGPVMNNSADVVLFGNATALNYGYSVASAGDFNGDGYSDVIVGATTTFNTFHVGSAYIYYGGLSMNGFANINITDNIPFTYFGCTVSSAGDVNGDGKPDIMVGASDYNSNTGFTNIYYGSNPAVKPNLISVKDVPNDQGGFVKLKWIKSAYDIPVMGTVTSYLIEKSLPPGTTGFHWEQIGTVLPTQNNLYYYYTASTPADSGSSGNSTLFFRVTAYTGASTIFYRSNITSGHSIDNIAPNQVLGFASTPVSGSNRLTWIRNHETDLKNYVIYRSLSPSIDVNTEPAFATVTDSTYLDTAPLNGLNYYFIVAQDIHNNKSPVAIATSPAITLNLTMFIEGFYNSSTNLQVSDTVKVYLRNVVTPFGKVDSAKAVVSANGSSTLLFGNAPSGQYYIVITHRNALETWSKAGGESLIRGGSLNYDISDAATKAFGNNIKQIDNIPVRFGLFSGDVNHDGYIDLTDINLVFNDAANFTTGYLKTDANGDSFTDLTDIVITFNNSSNFVSVVKP